MKNTIAIFFILLVSMNLSFAKKNKSIAHPIVGAWKYINKTSVSEFDKITYKNTSEIVTAEYFKFDADNHFCHYFLNNNGEVVKSMSGSWKMMDNKIQIKYKDIKFTLLTDFFFIGTDLILGKNFNHVVFTSVNKTLDNLAMAIK
jgi:hypothetical protein